MSRRTRPPVPAGGCRPGPVTGPSRSRPRRSGFALRLGRARGWRALGSRRPGSPIKGANHAPAAAFLGFPPRSRGPGRAPAVRRVVPTDNPPAPPRLPSRTPALADQASPGIRHPPSCRGTEDLAPLITWVARPPPKAPSRLWPSSGGHAGFGPFGAGRGKTRMRPRLPWPRTRATAAGHSAGRWVTSLPTAGLRDPPAGAAPRSA
jgi:hypothetical protein